MNSGFPIYNLKSMTPQERAKFFVFFFCRALRRGISNILVDTTESDRFPSVAKKANNERLVEKFPLHIYADLLDFSLGKTRKKRNTEKSSMERNQQLRELRQLFCSMRKWPVVSIRLFCGYN